MSEPTTRADRIAALRQLGYNERDEPVWSRCLVGKPGTLVETTAEVFRDHRIEAVRAERERCIGEVDALTVSSFGSVARGIVLRIIRGEST